MKIGVLSDTHNYLPKKAIHYLQGCDEIWHGGDIGSINVLEKKNLFERATQELSQIN